MSAGRILRLPPEAIFEGHAHAEMGGKAEQSLTFIYEYEIDALLRFSRFCVRAHQRRRAAATHRRAPAHRWRGFFFSTRTPRLFKTIGVYFDFSRRKIHP